jgi:hypothetical protein
VFLASCLDRHPDVFVAKPFTPEPKVFMGPVQDADTYRLRYARLFADARGQKARCEKTSYYLESDQACQLIRTHLPDVRVLFIVREPVARAYSNYLWSRKNGLETLSFEEAVEREGRRPSPLPPEKAYARPYDYLSRGRYATFAQRYLESLGRERVAFFLFEDITRNPRRLFTDLQRFIGVDPAPFEQLDVGVVNSARELGPPLDPGLKARLKQRLAPEVKRFGGLTGLDLSVWEYGPSRDTWGRE